MDNAQVASLLPREVDDDETLAASSSAGANTNTNHGWQKVTYAKHQRRPPPAARPSDPYAVGADLRPNGNHAFASIEQKSQERRFALESARAAAAAAVAEAAVRSRGLALPESDGEDDDSGAEDGVGKDDGAGESKKAKPKKPKKPKVTVAEAASKIDAVDLSAFLVDVAGNYESQSVIQLMRFADYFARSFSAVSASQFPWVKMLKESPVAKIVDVPICHISDSVYKTSVDWISQRPIESLGTFVLWSLDSILADLVNQQAPAKGSKKPAQQPSSKAQVAIFLVLAMTLRRKPDVLLNILPVLREKPKFQGQDKLSVIIWVFAQASQGDPVVGMYSWVHNLLPLVCGKSSANPQARDLILQLAERILSGPKARPILLNGAVRKGERLVPPSALEQLMHVTFPAPSVRLKATDRFEAVYPTLRELALAGSPGAKAMKPVSQQLLPVAVKAMQENIPELSREATDIFIWCLIQNPECFKQWEKIYLEDVKISVAVLRKLSDGWKEYSTKFPLPDSLRETLKNLRVKNEEALAEGLDASSQASIKEADKHCKVILGRVTRRSGCMKSGLCLLTVAVAVGAFVLAPNMESWDLKKLYVMFSSST